MSENAPPTVTPTSTFLGDSTPPSSQQPVPAISATVHPALSSSRPPTETTQLQPSQAETAAHKTQRRGRKSTFTPEQDLLIVREVAAKKGHIADFGKKGATFEEVRKSLVATGVFKVDVEAKNVQDRYNRMQKDFDKKDIKLSKMSGLGGEESEIDELLSGMKEARDDLLKKKNAEKTKAKEIEERKLAAGRRMVEMATHRKGKKREGGAEVISGSSDDDGELSGDVQNRSEEGDDVTPKKKRRKRNTAINMSGDLASFGESLQAADNHQLTLEREKLILEQARCAFEQTEREKERQERREEMESDRQLRREEREAQNRLELDKFKLMMEVMTRKEK